MHTILVQDTEKDILELLTVALEFEGFTVYSILDYTEEFINLIGKHRPHVVVLDYRLDGVDCREVVRLIKKEYPHLPVIATSCNINIHQEYDKHGFDGYIKKPFDLDLLYKTIRKHIVSDN